MTVGQAAPGRALRRPWSPGLRAWGAGRLGAATLLAGLTAALVLLAAAIPVNHDEDLYVAATVLAGRLTLYRDFLYLQTPLLPQALAWLPPLVPGHAFFTLRLTSVVFAAVTLGAVWTAQWRLGAIPAAAAAATALMAACYPFLFAAAVYRNDALPVALLSLGLLGMAGRGGAPAGTLGWTVGGLALALAASAKVTYAVPLAAAGVVLLLQSWRDLAAAAGRIAGFAGGAALGLLPCLLAWRAAPAGFVYGVEGFWARDFAAWYVANGLGFRMGVGDKLLSALLNLAEGPALPALVVVGWSEARRLLRGGRLAGSALLLDGLTLAGLAAALIPSPGYKQYFVVLLPPLFVSLGVSGFGAAGGVRPRWSRPLLTLGALVGVVVYGVLIGQGVAGGAPTVERVARETRWLDQRLRAAGRVGPTAALSSRLAADSGGGVDPRFSTGTVAYRVGDRLSLAERRLYHVASPGALASDFDARPPPAVVVGYEDAESDFRIKLEPALRAWAVSHGYRLERSPFGRAELYLRP